MGKNSRIVAVVCAACGDDFTLTEQGYAKRVERYGERLLCQRCLGDVWLRTRGKHTNRDLLPERDACSPA
jgi:hypothetical protein